MNRAWKHVDAPLWMMGLTLSIIGLFAILDAGYAKSLASNSGMLPKEFIVQFVLLLVGIGLSLGLAAVRPDLWRKAAPYLFWTSVSLLVLVELIGRNQNGAKRWLNVGILIQPAEFVKFTTILYLASVLADRPLWKDVTRPSKDIYGYLKHTVIPKVKRALPLLFVFSAVFLIEREKDLGTACVVVFVALVLLILGKATMKSVGLVTAGIVLFSVVMVKAQPYRMERITSHAARWEPQHFDDEGFLFPD